MTPSSPEQQEANKDNYISTGIVIITVGKIWLFIWHAQLTRRHDTFFIRCLPGTTTPFDDTLLCVMTQVMTLQKRGASQDMARKVNTVFVF